MRRSIIFMLLAGLLTLPALSQSYAIRNARIVTVSGDVIERGTVVVTDGMIAAVGTSARAPRGARVIDGKGLTVYPGLFNADTNIGLTEVGAVPVTNDGSEMGDYTPQLLAWTALHVESEHIPVARVDGITHVVTRPNGGTIPGQGAVVHLSGWSQEEMEISRRGALYISLPELLATRSRRFGRGAGRSYTDAKKQFDEKVDELREIFARVRQYAETNGSGDRQMDALVDAVAGKQLVILAANSHIDIKNAVEFAESENLNFAILGASDAWRIPEYLKEHNVKVILGARQVLPGSNDDALDSVYEAPRILQENGVKFAITTGGSSNVRTLAFEVGNTVSRGLSQEDALRSITLTPAEIFGVDDRVGSIDVGKIANLVVADGDIFDYQTKIQHVFINGAPISLESKHTELYRKYLNRP